MTDDEPQYMVECYLCRRLVDGMAASKVVVCGECLHENQLCRTVEIRFYCYDCLWPDVRYIV